MGGILSIYFAIRGRHNKVFPCDWGVGVSEKQEREKERESERRSDGGKARKNEGGGSWRCYLKTLMQA